MSVRRLLFVVLLAGLVVLGLVQFVFVNRREFSERPVFIVHLFSIAGLIIYIILFDPLYPK